jgi:DNA-binding NarL/FixJ family response regulator
MISTTFAPGGEVSPVKVFLVEDSPLIRNRLYESLDSPGRIEVVGHADTERDATAALTARPWDAVVLDLRLREGTGFGVLRALGAVRSAGRKVIVYTNYAVPRLRDECTQLGADYVLDKGADYDHLRELLDEMAEARRD